MVGIKKPKSIQDIRGKIFLNPSDKERRRIQAELDAQKKPPILLPKEEIRTTRLEQRKEPGVIRPSKQEITLTRREPIRLGFPEPKTEEQVVEKKTSFLKKLGLIASLPLLIFAGDTAKVIPIEEGEFSLSKASLLAGRVITGAGIGVAGGAGLITTKSVLATGATIATGSGIMTWLASDNLLSSMNIFTRDTAKNVQSGDLSQAEALEDFDEAQGFINKAKDFINVNTAANPLLWPFRNIILANAEAAQNVVDRNKEIIENIEVQETGFVQTFEEAQEQRNIETEETFQRRQTEIQEASERRTEQFEAAQEARDEAEKEKFDRIRQEGEERARENTLFFEAIRKRNAGLELTDEERQILIDRGVSPDPLTRAESTFRRRSRVQF